MPDTDDLATLRQHARCYILLMIRGYLMTDKSNSQVHLRCGSLSWGSAVLAWTYHSLCSTAYHSTTDIWCPPERQVYMYPMTVRLIGMIQQSRDQHEQRVLRWHRALDQLQLDEFLWTPYNDPALQDICPLWLNDEAEWRTWMSVVPLVCFNIDDMTDEADVQLLMVLRHCWC
ncbi:hypothetical protein Ahy_B05g079671 [Arachis hypogaea]|uniref:Aminotransferase-like plant mobile domain-containing protein n=1 Tax=Arachis hypogaea TaxID=3818 RepID=A0A444ZAJ6_ARAHY|nr:hypothetical protein Ahy_B05g079671 [Arachis hypogaea]